jgi:hypothetical protein
MVSLKFKQHYQKSIRKKWTLNIQYIRKIDTKNIEMKLWNQLTIRKNSPGKRFIRRVTMIYFLRKNKIDIGRARPVKIIGPWVSEQLVNVAEAV